MVTAAERASGLGPRRLPLPRRAAHRTAHASLSRQGQLLTRDGLFEVVPAPSTSCAGLDLSVISVIEGDTGVIVDRPADSKGTAAAAWALTRSTAGQRRRRHRSTRTPTSTTSAAHGRDRRSRRRRRPDLVELAGGLIEEAVAENVFVGTAIGTPIGLHVRRGAPQGARAGRSGADWARPRRPGSRR